MRKGEAQITTRNSTSVITRTYPANTEEPYINATNNTAHSKYKKHFIHPLQGPSISDDKPILVSTLNQANFLFGFDETSSNWSVPCSSVFLCFSLAAVNRQTSYDSYILRQHLGCMTVWLINLICPNRKQTVRAVHSCNKLILSISL